MKFNKNRLPKTRQELDEFVRQHGLRPFGVVRYRDRDIFIAETDVETDKPCDYPLGYYQTAWFLTKPDSDEKMDIGRWLEFEYMHDFKQDWTTETKRQARAQAAIEDAIKFIDRSFEKGRYGRKEIHEIR